MSNIAAVLAGKASLTTKAKCSHPIKLFSSISFPLPFVEYLQNERKKILEHGLEAYNAMMDGKKDLPPPMASSSHEMMPPSSSSSKHKVSFQELGKAIGRRWKDIPKKDLERYQVLAKEESARYRREIKIYNDAEEKRRRDCARKLYSKPDSDDKGSDDSFNSSRRSSRNQTPSINASVAAIARQHGMTPEDLIKHLGSQLLQLRQQPSLPVAGFQLQPQQAMNLPGLLGGQQQQSAQSVSLQAQQIILAQSEQIRTLQEQVNFLMSQQGGSGNSNHGGPVAAANTTFQPGLNGGLSLSHTMGLSNSGNGAAPLPTSINVSSNVGSESSRSAVTSDQSYSAGSSSPTNNNDPLSQLQAQLSLLQQQQQQQQQQTAMPGTNGAGGINVNAMLGLAPTTANGFGLDASSMVANFPSNRPLLREATSSLSDGSAGASDAAVGSASSTSSGGGARESEPQLPGWNLSVLQALAGSSQNGLK